jgi:heme A synthase
MSTTWSLSRGGNGHPMLSKILITLAVIFACMMVISNRAGSQLREIPNPAVEQRKKRMRIAAYLFMVIMLIAAGIMIYLELRSQGA